MRQHEPTDAPVPNAQLAALRLTKGTQTVESARVCISILSAAAHRPRADSQIDLRNE